MSPLHFQGEFTKINIWLQLLKYNTRRLQTTQAQKQNISYAQAQTQETSYAQAQKQETSYAQAQKQETSNQTKLHKKLFEGWTLDIQLRVFTNTN